jgi:hypothetical protein
MAGTASNKVTIAVGILTVAIGCIPFLVMAGVLPRATAPAADPAPSWVGWMIGAVFVGAGLIAILRGMVGADDNSDTLPAGAPRALRLANNVIGLGIVCGLALLFSWVAFGPGPRHFSIGLDGLWMPASGAGSVIGRIAFGFGAILFWCASAAMAVMTLRKWRSR